VAHRGFRVLTVSYPFPMPCPCLTSPWFHSPFWSLKGPSFLFLFPDPVLFYDTLHGDCLLAQTISSFLNSGWPIAASLVLLLTLYKLSPIHQPHFSAEDEGSMFLQNICIYVQVHSVATQKTCIDTFMRTSELIVPVMFICGPNLCWNNCI
jgi:hypothetical protein